MNLTKLESRPVPGTAWRYRFYLDVEGGLHEQAMQEAMEQGTGIFRTGGTRETAGNSMAVGCCPP
jgi:prephenate dehydratase